MRLTLLLFFLVSAIAHADRPSILLIVSDNQSWCHTSFAGDPVVETPGFDRVAREGVYFENAFAPSPSCTPARSAILSGQDMWRTGEGGVLHGNLPGNLPLMTDLLREAGYAVAYTGKGWGPGRWNLLGRKQNPTGESYNRERDDAVPENIFRGDYAANFEAFLNDIEEGQPFCFWMGTKEPHRPFPEGLGPKTGKRLQEIPVPAFLPDNDVVRKELADYYAEIESQDRHVVRALELLETRGQLENTLIVVTSDNGIQMPRGITCLHDYGTRVPLAIRWGKVAAPGRHTPRMTNLIDLAPTTLAAAGVDVPDAMTGRSLMEVLTQVDTPLPVDNFVVLGMERHTLCRPMELPYPSRGIRTPDYLYIRNYEPDRWPAGAPDYQSMEHGAFGDVDSAATKDWMIAHQDDPEVAKKFALCFGKRPAEELYAVADDPDQVNNLALQEPDVAKALAATMDAHLTKTADPRAKGESPWDAYGYHYMNILKYKDQIENKAVIPGK